MPEPIKPLATKTFGRKNWVFVPAIASAALQPTVAEVTGASALDFSRIAFANGAPRPTQQTNRVSNERRFADTETTESIGTTQHQGGEMTYAFGPQAIAASDPKKLYEKIPGGTVGFLVERQGLPRATNFAAGQFVNVWPVEFGPSLPAEAGESEGAESAMTCSYAVGVPAIGVAILT